MLRGQARLEAAPRIGAGEGTRTLGINLGKVALYQLSYARTQVLVREDSLAPE